MDSNVKYLGGSTLGKIEDVGEDGDGFSPCPNVFGAAVYVLCYVKVWFFSVFFFDNDFGSGGGGGSGFWDRSWINGSRSSRHGSNLATFILLGHDDGSSFFRISIILKK